MLVKSFLLSMFFWAAVQANETPPYEPGLAPEAQMEHQEPQPGDSADMNPPEEMEHFADEPPPPDFMDPSEESRSFGNEPTTPYKALKIVKKPKVIQKKVAYVQPLQRRSLPTRNIANAPMKKKVGGIKSVKPFCSMRALASSTSKELGKTRARSRLWVEEVNPSWFKIYRRAGAAFIQASCLR